MTPNTARLDQAASLLFCKHYFHKTGVKYKEPPHLGLVCLQKKKKKFYNLEEFFPIFVINNPKMAFAFL